MKKKTGIWAVEIITTRATQGSFVSRFTQIEYYTTKKCAESFVQACIDARSLAYEDISAGSYKMIKITENGEEKRIKYLIYEIIATVC